MELHKLFQKLNEMYFNSEKGEAVAMIHLFAITYAKDIKSTGRSMREIAKGSGINESYGTEISKGVKLAKYVVPK